MSQLVQLESLPAENFPEGQFVQPPNAEKYPAVQASQVWDEAEKDIRPTGQIVHAVALLIDEKYPMGQYKQFSAPETGEYWPDEQILQELFGPSEAEPGGQAVLKPAP